MHILEVNTVYQFGSTGRIVKDLKDTLESKGHTVTVVCGRDYGDKEERVHVIGSKLQAYLDALSARLFDNAGFGLQEPTQQLISIIKNEKPDIIHLHNIHGYYINIEILFRFLKQENVNIVWTFHDCWPFTGHCTFFDYVNCEKWRTECNRCVQKNKYPASYLIDRSKTNFSRKKELFTGIKNLTIVTPSQWLCNLVKGSYLKEYNAITINNGIDLEVFKPTESRIRHDYGLDNKIIILAVASIWGERKGYSSYFKLAKLLPDNYKIVMIGLNEKQEKELPSNILGIRRTSSQSELAAWYSAADVFLSFTEEDNFPTVNIESLACGLPVIANKAGGATEAFNEFTGIGIKKGNIKEVVEILTSGTYKSLSREACTKRAMEFEKGHCYNLYEKLFEDMLCRSNNV